MVDRANRELAVASWTKEATSGLGFWLCLPSIVIGRSCRPEVGGGSPVQRPGLLSPRGSAAEGHTKKQPTSPPERLRTLPVNQVSPGSPEGGSILHFMTLFPFPCGGPLHPWKLAAKPFPRIGCPWAYVILVEAECTGLSVFLAPSTSELETQLCAVRIWTVSRPGG